MEDNKRLKELKLSLHINHIDKSNDKIKYSTLMKLLTCLVATLGEKEVNSFTTLVRLTIGNSILRASDKEIVATCKRYFKNMEASKKLGISNGTFYNRYGDLLNRNFDNKEYLDSLHPMFNSEHDVIMVNFLNNFIDNFKFEVGKEDHDLANNERTFEIEFWLIYDKIMNIFRNVALCDKFIFNICNMFDIDYSTISQLKNNIHIINRSYPNFRYNNRYFMQEIVTLYTHKGLSKGSIGSKVLGKASSFLYNNTNQKYSEIPEEDLDWQYTPTIDWSSMKKGSVLKFIDIFHSFINYDV